MNYLFSRILELAQVIDGERPQAVNKMAHETLVLACHEGLRGTGQAYGNLFSQVDFLCRRHNMRVPDRIALQALRRGTNGSEAIDRADFMYGLHALCRLVSAITGDDVPAALLRVLPPEDKAYSRTEGVDVRYIRCIVRSWDTLYIYVAAEKGLDGQTLAVDYSDESLAYLRKMLREGMQLNLLDCKMSRTAEGGTCAAEGVENVVKPGLVVVEPDYLIDISSVAACFKDYGHHPLTYTIERMRPRQNSSAILLGNLAGAVLDDIVNEGGTFSLAETLRRNFADKALEYCSCAGFDAKEFKAEAERQAANIAEAVRVMFNGHDRSRAVLEPSFVCERLGLQGRVDLMTDDFRLLVEQKSGKNHNIASGRPGNHGSMQLEPHYVQLLLYYGVLRYNFQLGNDRLDIRLLYSKYAPESGLVAVAFYQKLFREAIKLRNLIVATDFTIARSGFGKVLPLLSPATVNTAGMDNSFYHTWLLPQIEAVTAPLRGMPPLEKEYFCAMATFVYREQLLGKVGTQEGVSACSADRWNMPVSEKTETGNIYTGLTITAKRCGGDGDTPDILTLAVPDQGESFLPNFRRGDMIYLYPYRRGQQPDARNALLYKGSIAELHTAELTIALANGQKNPEILKVSDGGDGTVYAVEHAGSDSNSGGALRGLHEFITAPASRKALLLGQRAPERDASRRLTRAYNEAYDDVLLRVKQADDYFLLVGPPGTGKTSMAIRYMVEEELAADGASMLLMAYTNRAVDELCAMLESAGTDYIRIGSEYSADPAFKHRLLAETVRRCPRLGDVRAQIAATRVIVGTTSTIMSRPFVFDIKAFTLAIIDEASQILEPNIIGLLSAHRTGDNGQQECRIRKFVLTGDHKQLPAVVRQDEGASAVSSGTLRAICLDNCRNSLFERLLRIERSAGRKEFTGVLRRHGRMHPEVAYFPCHEFYESERLEAVPLPHQQETELPYADIGLADRLDTLLRTRRMVFIQSPECRRPELSDKVNTAEAAIVADVMRRVRLMLGTAFDAARSIGVIVPYRNQIAVIRREVEQLGMPELETVSIDTVERYQGSQRDVIIYSFTVQNEWQLEFLAGSCFDEDGHTIDRKLNVALTRARRQTIMTGNAATLGKNLVFRQLMEYVKEKGGLL